MTTQDETILRNEQDDAQAAAVLNEATTDQRKTARWQTVTIGGIAGIAMGAAASQIYEAHAAKSDETVELIDDAEAAATAETETAATATEVHQATVGQDLSFADAFAAARAEVGPGGVFLWHGQLYNTYTSDEWNTMSDAEKDEFATDVRPYLSQQAVQEPHAPAGPHIGTEQPNINVRPVTNIEEPAKDEPEVHFLGVESREVEGQTVNIGHMTVNDVNVALVDMDDDQVFDISLMDRNRNGELEDNEITDISDCNLTVEDFQMAVTLEEVTDGQPEQAMTQQEDLAPEMPDYMNDAEVDIA